MSSSDWNTKPDVIFAEEQNLVDSALSGSADNLFRVIPSKSIWKPAPDVLGIKSDVYKDVISSTLLKDEAVPQVQLIESEWRAILPECKFQSIDSQVSC